MSQAVIKRLQSDANYVKDMRWRLERAHRRIDELILVNEQLRRVNNIYEERGEPMNAVDIALEQLTKAKQEIARRYPPPYEFPSDIGRVAQLIDDSINTAKIIKSKMATVTDII